MFCVATACFLKFSKHFFIYHRTGKSSGIDGKSLKNLEKTAIATFLLLIKKNRSKTRNSNDLFVVLGLLVGLLAGWLLRIDPYRIDPHKRERERERDMSKLLVGAQRFVVESQRFAKALLRPAL